MAGLFDIKSSYLYLIYLYYSIYSSTKNYSISADGNDCNYIELLEHPKSQHCYLRYILKIFIPV